MIKIYIDQIMDKHKGYIEDMYSAYEIVEMDKEKFVEVNERYK